MKTTKQTQLKELSNPYNIKILRNFVLYFKEKLGWTSGQVEDLFKSCGSQSAFLDSDDNWFSQDFADRFYDRAVQLTGEPDLGYKVGVYTISEFSRGIGGLLIQGAFSASIAFRNIQRIAGVYTKGSYYQSISVNRESATIRSVAFDWCAEKPYQCQNRVGMLASIPLAFGCTQVSNTHPRCFHRGDPHCEYVIRWSEPLRYRPIPVAGLTSLLVFFISVLLGVSSTSAFLLAGNVAAITFILLREQALGTLRQTLAKQNQALEESIDVMGRRRDEQALLREIMQATTGMMPISDLSQLAANLIRREMGYDRVVLALVNRDKKLLITSASSGFDSTHAALLEKSEFKIVPDNTSGFFIRAVNQNAPVFERDVETALTSLSPRSQQIVRELGAKNLIVVPISFKEEVLGILSVDNTSPTKQLTPNDVELLSSLADHLAVAISNAKSFDKEREAKELFQKYVPSEVVDGQVSLDESDLTFLGKRTLSIMFIDIVGFTALSEKQPAENVAQLLNIYIEVINEIITQQGGRINKVIGDGLLIYFSPEINILDASYKVVQALPEINSRLRAKNFPEIAISIGCHKGMCTVGSIGYAKRLDYTLIGDTINTTSRIEKSTRAWGSNIVLFSEALLDEAKNYDYVSRGKISLRGKQSANEVFELQAALPKVGAA